MYQHFGRAHAVSSNLGQDMSETTCGYERMVPTGNEYQPFLPGFSSQFITSNPNGFMHSDDGPFLDSRTYPSRVPTPTLTPGTSGENTAYHTPSSDGTMVGTPGSEVDQYNKYDDNFGSAPTPGPSIEDVIKACYRINRLRAEMQEVSDNLDKAIQTVSRTQCPAPPTELDSPARPDLPVSLPQLRTTAPSRRKTRVTMENDPDSYMYQYDYTRDKYICTYTHCNSGFAHRLLSRVRTHYHGVHLKHCRFQCPVCRRKFVRKNDMDRHIISYHTNQGSPRRK